MKRNRDLEDRRARYRARLQNRVSQDNGAGGPYDMGTSAVPSMCAMPPMQQDFIASRLYLTDWQSQKIVDIPVDDILREGWEHEGLTDEQSKDLARTEAELDVMGAFERAMKIERLLGGAAIFMGVADEQANPSMPLGKGRVSWLTVLPRTRLSVAEWEVDALSPRYGNPKLYRVDGHLVHASRLVLFDGQPLSKRPDTALNPPELMRNDGFGVSRLLAIHDDLIRATGTRQAAYQLVNRASVIIAEIELAAAGTDGADPALQAVRDVVNQINLYRGAVIDKDPMSQGKAISTMSASFGSVPELVLSFLQVLSAASDIPATRFIGQAPGGLNATGESDLENYYGRLESQQRRRTGPQLLQVLRQIQPALTGIKWPPLWSLSEQEEATVRQTDTDTVIKLVDGGVITSEEGAAQLRERGVLTAPGVGMPLGDPAALTGEIADPAAALAAAQKALSNGDLAQ